MSLKKGLQKSTNYTSKIPQPIFPNSPVIYELETRTFQQKSVLNCSQNCFSQNSLPDFSKSARSVQSFTNLSNDLCAKIPALYSPQKSVKKTGEM